LHHAVMIMLSECFYESLSCRSLFFGHNKSGGEGRRQLKWGPPVQKKT
jgi:hypothetical protein